MAVRLENNRPVRLMPLGGCGEMGMNAMLIEDGADAILVDCGVQFGGISTPMIDRLIPDFRVFERDDRNLRAVVVTHGHLDHIGALPQLLRDYDVPVYGPAFALALLESRLEEFGVRNADLRSVGPGDRIELVPDRFEVEWVRTTHSIPDNHLVAIGTRGGVIVHSGDFKIDPDPLDGQPTDVDRLTALGEGGVSLLLSDSTNSERPGRNRHERVVEQELERLVLETEGAAVVALFSSHVHRLQAVMRAAAHSGRRVALVGRSLKRTWAIAKEQGLIDADSSLIIDEKRIQNIGRGRLLVAVSGTQGEPRAGLFRLAYRDVYGFGLRAGDRMIFSARTIPGNEISVRRVINRLVKSGVDVITDRDHPVHTSGHAKRDEQADLISWLKPHSFVPVHGDRAMLEAHARTAHESGVDKARTFIIEDGDSVILEGGDTRLGASEAVTRRGLDQQGFLLDWDSVTDVQRVTEHGAIWVSVVLGSDRTLRAPPKFSALGFRLSDDVTQALAERVEDACLGLEANVEASIENAVLGFFRRGRTRRPRVFVHLIPLGSA